MEILQTIPDWVLFSLATIASPLINATLLPIACILSALRVETACLQVADRTADVVELIIGPSITRLSNFIDNNFGFLWEATN